MRIAPVLWLFAGVIVLVEGCIATWHDVLVSPTAVIALGLVLISRALDQADWESRARAGR